MTNSADDKFSRQGIKHRIVKNMSKWHGSKSQTKSFCFIICYTYFIYFLTISYIYLFFYSIASDKTNTVTVTPNSGAALYRKDSNPSFNVNRPSTLKVASPGGTPPSSEPIPVPTQVAAYQRMQGNSPLSPQQPNKTFESGSPLKKVCDNFLLLLLLFFSKSVY